MQRDLGDFPTPPALVKAVLATLGPVGDRWPRVLEPTCGRGHVLSGLIGSDRPPAEIIGIERQPAYAAEARRLAEGLDRTPLTIIEANLFDLDLRRALPWRGAGPLLVVGNPPWVTAATLGSLGSGNQAPRFSQGDPGLDGRTGRANFDLAEAIWLKLLAELADQRPTIALLCKLSVARRVFGRAMAAGRPIVGATLRRINARAWFGASVEAGLFRLDLGDGPACDRIDVYPDLNADQPEGSIGLVDGLLVADLAAHAEAAFALGRCPATWRQGVKHDLAPILELSRAGACGWTNGLGEPVEVEPGYVYPLLKAADLRDPDPRPRRGLIVPQTKAGAETSGLASAAPRLWGYLARHAARFAARRSSIYRGGPAFGLFGLGAYSFAPYKVAVAGFQREPRFRAVGPFEGRPVMFDDTTYFLPCATAEEAASTAALLAEPACVRPLDALVFRDAKRPVTKAVLQRIDLKALAERADRPALLARAGVEWARLEGKGPPLERLAMAWSQPS